MYKTNIARLYAKLILKHLSDILAMIEPSYKANAGYAILISLVEDSAR